MQSVIIAFIGGIACGALSCAVLVVSLMKRIHDLEKYTLILNNVQAYSILQSEKPTKPDPITAEQDRRRDLQREYARILMGDTVTDEDIKKFGEREAAA